MYVSKEELLAVYPSLNDTENLDDMIEIASIEINRACRYKNRALRFRKSNRRTAVLYQKSYYRTGIIRDSERIIRR